MIAMDLDKGWVFDRPEWKQRLADIAAATNKALLNGDHAAARAAREDLFAGLEALKAKYSAAAEISIKASRNELIRVYMIHGWYAEAEEVARAAVKGLKVDKYCPNREPIVQETLARVLMAAGKLDEAEKILNEAIAMTRQNIKRVKEAWARYPTENSWPRPMHGGARPAIGRGPQNAGSPGRMPGVAP